MHKSRVVTKAMEFVCQKWDLNEESSIEVEELINIVNNTDITKLR